MLVTLAGQAVTAQATAQPVDHSSLVDDRAITIASAEDIAAKRRELIAFIWGTKGFPSAKQPSVDIGIPSPLPDLENLRSVNRLRFAMENDEANMAYQFVPRIHNGKVVIVHQGHACSLDDRSGDPSVRDGVYGTIKALLGGGFTVVAMFMPRHNPADCRPFGVHDEMFDGALSTGNAIKFFLEPTAVALNYLKAQGYTDFNMTGLSGGGWTTTLYAAIDPTIRQSFPVAGSIPLYLRPQNSLAGDTEQVLPELYKIAGYLDLYVMGAAGPNRRQVQILNRRDDCCFGERQHTGVDGAWHEALRRYEIRTRLALEAAGRGSFRLEIDDAAAFHSISHHGAVNVILAELQGSLPEVAAANATEAYLRGANGNLWQRTASRWVDTGLPMTGVPTVIDDSEHSVDVFYRDPNNALRRAYMSGDAWVSASLPGSPLLNDPVAFAGSDGRWDVFSSSVDVRLNRWYWRPPWLFLGNERLSETARIHGLPAPVSPSLASYNVFFRGWDDAVWEVSKDSVTGWTLGRVGDAGRRIAGYPSAALVDSKARVYLHASTVAGAAVSPGSDPQSGEIDATKLYEAVRGSDGSWVWTALPLPDETTLAGSPGATSSGGTPRVFSRTSNHRLGAFTLSEGSWQFADEGGQIAGSPTVVPGGVWVRGLDGDLQFFDGTSWSARGAPDTQPPRTTITSGPRAGATIGDTTPEFTFESDESGSTFECSLDGGAFATCSSPYSPEPLTDGEHTVAVRAIDAAGNVDASPASRTFTVVRADPTLVAQASRNGNTITDTATVSGPAGSPAPTGTVTFTVYGPDDATCTGPVFATSTHAVSAGSFTASPVSVRQPGIYRFVASYSGDAHYAAQSTPCNAAGQSVVIVPRAVADFDGDGTTDRSVYRGGAWYVHDQTTEYLGLAGYIPVQSDYDGDGDTDRAVYRDGVWYIAGEPTTLHGLPGFTPVPGDYDGDGDADRAVYDPATGAWYIAGGPTVFLGGSAGDIPVPGDYDGDGDTEPAVYRGGAWYVDKQATEFLGLPGYIPVPGDYDGDGDTDRAVFNDGAWYLHDQATVFHGLAGDVPVPGDYDGDGAADRAVYRNGAWYVHDQATAFFGLAGDLPLPLPQAIYQASFGT